MKLLLLRTLCRWAHLLSDQLSVATLKEARKRTNKHCQMRLNIRKAKILT